MRPDDARAVADVAGRGVGAIIGAVEGVQAAVTRRAYGALGPVAVVPRVAQQAVTSGVYAAVRGSVVVASRVAGAVAQRRGDDDAPPLHDTRRAGWLSALNSAFGDGFADSRSPLAGRLSIRVAGRAVTPASDALTAAFPVAHPRVAVFLHGLGHTERAWGEPSYGERLERDLGGVTAVHLRYNTGRHISSNGRDLATLLDDLVAHWPVPVSALVLVGHSMGGLVIRSACHYAGAADHAWPALVTDVVSIGTPHRGAPLERAVNIITAALGAIPEVAPIAKLVDRRSAGVKDLRYGYLLDDDWAGYDADEVGIDRGADVALHPSARQHFIAATLSTKTGTRLGAMVGDLLVVPASAHGQAYAERRTSFPLDHAHHVSGTHHLALLRQGRVYDVIRDALTPPPLSEQ